MKRFHFIFLLVPLFFACHSYKHKSAVGWDYNSPKNGGFQKVPFVEQETAPGMVLYQGNELIIDHPEQGLDSMTVCAFYIGKYEETNVQYRAYLNYLKQYYSTATYEAALPDTNFWYQHYDTTAKVEWSDAKYYAHTYMHHPFYNYYPVLGLNALQIERYAQWKTDRVNEYILIREGILPDIAPKDSTEVFVTSAYFAKTRGEEGTIKNIEDLNPDTAKDKKKQGRAVRFEDGILMPHYRLPTKSEWQLARMDIGSLDGSYPKEQSSQHTRYLKQMKRFWYLAPVEYLFRKDKERVTLYLDNMNIAMKTQSNKHHVFGLEDNAHEIVSDATGYHIIGHSTASRMKERGASVWRANDSKSCFVHTIIEPCPIEESQHTIYGFRLAMDHYGIPPKEY